MKETDKQLLMLKDYPAQLVIGRVTTDGVLVLVDPTTLNDYIDAVLRIEKYESANRSGLTYRFEVVALDDVGMAEAEMRLDLIKEAHDKGLPTHDWE